jgi:glycosyltransferase involved in cell wall biosynthesis
VAPVVNDAPNNRLVSNNPYIEYVAPTPSSIAERLIEVLDRPDAVERSVKMSASVKNLNWESSGTQFVDAFERAMRG